MWRDACRGKAIQGSPSPAVTDRNPRRGRAEAVLPGRAGDPSRLAWRAAPARAAGGVDEGADCQIDASAHGAVGT
jgi:hypothetical protein